MKPYREDLMDDPYLWLVGQPTDRRSLRGWTLSKLSDGLLSPMRWALELRRLISKVHSFGSLSVVPWSDLSLSDSFTKNSSNLGKKGEKRRPKHFQEGSRVHNFQP